MAPVEHLETPPQSGVTLPLDDIQAGVLRDRPEPYFGTHVLLHIGDGRVGCDLLRRLIPHVDSVSSADATWIGVALSYTGLAALGVPDASLQSFPETFRVGMAARAD